MTTFSQLVDDMISELKRPDLKTEIASYVNQTIRELHFTGDRNAIVLFQDNFREEVLVATEESVHSWEIPNPQVFQQLSAVKYLTVSTRLGQDIWPEATTPGRHLANKVNYYYRVGQTYVFAGFGGINGQIAIGYFEYPRSLKYKEIASRSATYDEDSGWAYADAVNTPELQEAARELSSNWILLRWKVLVEEGVRAKVYKRLSDTERARTAYSMYGSLRQGFWTAETIHAVGI